MSKYWFRQIHKWLGVLSCVFILLVSLTAILLSHPELYQQWSQKPAVADFNLSQAQVFSQDPFDKSQLIASDGKALYKSLDRGQTWGEIKLFVPADKVSAIVFSPLKQGRLWIALREVGIYFSEDGGEIWEAIDELPFEPVEGEYIRAMQVTQAHDLLVQTELGFYQYFAQANQWRNLTKVENKAQVLNFKDWVYRLHTGKFEGTWGLILYDLIAISLILLSLSGLYLSFKPKKRIKKTQKLETSEHQVKPSQEKALSHLS